MELRESNFQHSLAHLQIGDAVITNTVGAGPQRFGERACNDFYRNLRTGYGEVLAHYALVHGIEDLAHVIEDEQHNEFDEIGNFGKFAGRIALRKSGLAIVEKQLHHEKPDISAALRDALKHSVSTLINRT